VKFELKKYQAEAVNEVAVRLGEAREDYREKDRRVSFSLSAITGAGKTVMAAAIFEILFDGSADLAIDGDPSATILWVTDDPNLNEQTRFRLMEASERLSPSSLQIIDDGFDQERFESRNVYFLNRQKLTAKTFIEQSDERTYTLWETISNSIDDPETTVYMVLDEAHRGVTLKKSAADEEDRLTTVLRLINGVNGTPPMPIVLGISATVERFNAAMKDAKNRTSLPSVEVDNMKVQASGLLKDTISLDLPIETGAFETVLAKAAGEATRQSTELWDQYAEQEGVAEPVVPLLVVQVPNKPSSSDVADVLDAIHGAWPELPEGSVANVFGEHATETYGKYEVPYVAPQDVQDSSHVRVLLAKDAISTGWDCPRAETLLSLRAARDRVHITQLLGRLVRTPLARRIDSDERLNAVTCFLPLFDLPTAREVVEVMTGAEIDAGEVPPPSASRVLIEPVTMLWNKKVPKSVATCLASLPSEAAPREAAKPIKRLFRMAAELAIDDIAADPTATAKDQMVAVLDGQLAQHKKDVGDGVEELMTADIARLTADRLKDSSSEVMVQLDADDRTIDDAFKKAIREFGQEIATDYVTRLALEGGENEEEIDLYRAKAKVAILASLPEVGDSFDDAAEKLVEEWFAEHHAAIKNLKEDRRSRYEDIREQASDPQKVEIVVPVSRIEQTFALEDGKKTELETVKKHVLSDDSNNFPIEKLGSWETEIMKKEIGRGATVGWYRNPSGAARDALRVPWHDGQRWRSMQPDFLFFGKKDSGEIGASILDPHSHHLGDALPKLRGLADFAEKYGRSFVRVEALSMNTDGALGEDTKDHLILLDLTSEKVRDAIAKSSSAADAYRKAGQVYS